MRTQNEIVQMLRDLVVHSRLTYIDIPIANDPDFEAGVELILNNIEDLIQLIEMGETSD